ncbi:phosphate ABC transporter substrate-binding protein [Paenibacillus sp. UNC499MF]|uniref:phosphate ABC transporter substrate-binding protein n=1 Tax=Paenibacillus sp. UNC499MF TaxID=1502751 RepID=UPI00089F8D35|nr:phosphate ABC transporter substrate-binding protein [Paenibacillus sp. UNC499MF]SEG68681.1 phosphate transport system substrate-binding protein [Paenibacillus sp. UNC499MF]
MLKFMSKKGLSISLAAVLTLGVLAGCGKTDTNAGSPATSNKPAETTAAQEISGTVTASGSSALLPLVKEAAKLFMEKNPKVTINPTAGGSGKGLKDVADGISNIGNSDVAAGDEYKDKNLKEHVVAIAPFALIVNPDVNIEGLTKQQAADIFMGKIKNWKEVGGKDAPINVVHRPDSSGSRKLVQQIVLDGKDFTKEGVVQESTGAVKTAVGSQSGSIGYIDTPYLDNTVKALKFDNVAFAKETIKDGSYKLFGTERMYTKGEPTGATKAFLDYIMSPEFQTKKVEELKFLPADLLKK